ncbi:MAG: hypothetical protein ACE5J5_05160 [Candidatus Hydrothermarchaeales archaeon]
METWMIIILYAVIGALFQIIKKFDEKGSYGRCIITGTACGVLAGFLITEHKVSTFILGGLIVGFLISGRLNNIGYYFGLAAVFSMVFYYAPQPITLGYLLIIAGATLIDEVLAMGERSGISSKISNFHPTINLLLVVLLIIDIVPLLGMVAFIVSEFTYKLGALAFEK